METPSSGSFSSRRAAAGSLPPFSLPPPPADVPSMNNHSINYSFEGPRDLFIPSSYFCSSPQNLKPEPKDLRPPIVKQEPQDSPPPTFKQEPQDYPPQFIKLEPLKSQRPETKHLTKSLGGSEGLSPSISSVNTTSSQGSQAPAGMQYTTYAGPHSHGSWPTPGGGGSYTVSSVAQGPQPSLGQQGFPGRPMYSQGPGMQQFNHPRSSQSPATGPDGLPPPPDYQVHPTFQTPLSGAGGGGQGNPSGLTSAPQPPQSAILTSQTPVSTQPQPSPSASAHVDPYAHSRPPNAPSYYTASSTPQQPSFPAYAPHPSPTQHSPTSAGPVPRGIGAISGQPQGPTMAPPHPYRYPPYTSLPTMSGSVLSNIHQPGTQMSMIPGMNIPPQYGHHTMMYQPGQPPAPHSERPFKCDQCIQSFSRNHDLKRHKRIHLAVKPFPCTFCSKSFSRKDALKVRRTPPCS